MLAVLVRRSVVGLIAISRVAQRRRLCDCITGHAAQSFGLHHAHPGRPAAADPRPRRGVRLALSGGLGLAGQRLDLFGVLALAASRRSRRLFVVTRRSARRPRSGCGWSPPPVWPGWKGERHHAGHAGGRDQSPVAEAEGGHRADGARRGRRRRRAPPRRPARARRTGPAASSPRPRPPDSAKTNTPTRSRISCSWASWMSMVKAKTTCAAWPVMRWPVKMAESSPLGDPGDGDARPATDRRARGRRAPAAVRCGRRQVPRACRRAAARGDPP